MLVESDEIECLVKCVLVEEWFVVISIGSDSVVLRGIFLQFGVFLNVDNVENLKNYLICEFDWFVELMCV